MPSLCVVVLSDRIFLQCADADKTCSAAVTRARERRRDASVTRIDVSAILAVARSIARRGALARAVFVMTMMKFGEESGDVNFKGIQRVKRCAFMWTS
jgi:hypothetical protein